MTFELIDRIRFAIKQAEQPHLKPEQTTEITLQLADALERLESAERDFQAQFHNGLDATNRVLCEKFNGRKHDGA